MNTTMNIVKEIELKAEVELSQSGKQKLEEALIEMEQGQTAEFDSIHDLIKNLARVWDEQFESDVASGKLDRLAGQVISDFRDGKCKEL